MEEGRIEEICLPFLDAALAFKSRIYRIILTILTIVNTDMSHGTSLELSLPI